MLNMRNTIWIFLFLFAFVVIPFSIQAQTAQEILNQYISDLQKNPNDNALREKIIKHVQTMKPAPAIPEKARENYVMAATFVEKAKDSSGYARAIEQYKAALLVAPWWADAYKKQAMVQKAAAYYDDAIASLNLYILTQPADTRDAQDEIYKLKALKQSAAEDQLIKQREEEQRDAPKRLMRQLKAQYEGATYRISQCSYVKWCDSPDPQALQEFPCGCNEAEYGGKNWYSADENYIYITFPSDGSIVFMHSMANSTWLRGTAKGPNIKDILWEAKSRDQWVPVWTILSRGLDVIIYSGTGGEYNFPLQRPADDSIYNPSQRYGYKQFTKK
jgi:tetratricopeptide (TPR) repeat protein